MQAVEGILGSADGGRMCKGASGGKKCGGAGGDRTRGAADCRRIRENTDARPHATTPSTARGHTFDRMRPHSRTHRSQLAAQVVAVVTETAGAPVDPIASFRRGEVMCPAASPRRSSERYGREDHD